MILCKWDVTSLDCNPMSNFTCSQCFQPNKPECAWCLDNSGCQSQLTCQQPRLNSTQCPSMIFWEFFSPLAFSISPSSSSSGNLSLPISITGGFFVQANYSIQITGIFISPFIPYFRWWQLHWYTTSHLHLRLPTEFPTPRIFHWRIQTYASCKWNSICWKSSSIYFLWYIYVVFWLTPKTVIRSPNVGVAVQLRNQIVFGVDLTKSVLMPVWTASMV